MNQFRLLALGMFLSITAFAAAKSPLAGKTFRYDYDNGQSYVVKYTADTLTWECVKGEEEGKVETDPYQFKEVAPEIYLVTWVEKDKAFVNTVVNLKAMRVYSSGQWSGVTWLAEGPISEPEPKR